VIQFNPYAADPHRYGQNRKKNPFKRNMFGKLTAQVSINES
jgi:hypothetical protein